MASDKKLFKFFESCDELLATSKTFKDIYTMAVLGHKREKALTFINEKGKPQSIKYKHYKLLVAEYAAKLAYKLKEFPHNSVVAMKLRNCPEWPIIYWALLMAGYVPFLVDAKLPQENMETLIKDSKAVAVITHETISFSVLTINYLTLKQGKAPEFTENWANNTIFCSSGTTGNVKLMIYDGENMCHQIAAAKCLPERTKDIMHPGEINIICILPFHHIFGFVAVLLWYTFFGKNLVFIKDTSAMEILKTSQACGVTHAYAVPLLWDSLAQQLVRKAALEGEKKADLLAKMIAYNTGKISSSEAGLAASDLAKKTVQKKLLGSKIQYCISGGGYLATETLTTLNGIGYNLYNGFGMTEIGVSSVETSIDVKERLLGSIGQPMYGIEYKVDVKEGSQTGELLIKSNILHKEEIIDGVRQLPNYDDGYMRSGDIVMKDENGRFYIKGRIKDVIINENGENIYPDEIEDYFKEVKGVEKVCVVGIMAGKNQHEDITCIMEVQDGLDEDELKAIKEKCEEINLTLSNEKRVHSFLIATTRLPLTATMKVKRFQVKKMYAENPAQFIGFNEQRKVKVFEGYRKEDVEPVVKAVRSLFAKILILPINKIGDDDHWINNLGGDSMSYVELILSTNEQFGVEIPEDKYAKLTCVNDFAEEILILRGVEKIK